MRYLVVRKDLLGKRLKSSGDYLPKIVEASTPEGAVEAACRTWSSTYKPPTGREFLVVALSPGIAVIVRVRPVNQYYFETRPYGFVDPDDEDEED